MSNVGRNLNSRSGEGWPSEGGGSRDHRRGSRPDDRDRRENRDNRDNKYQQRPGIPKSIPDGWLDYSKYGKQIRGTHLITFKTPLTASATVLPPNERWTPSDLVAQVPNLGLVIDLTFTPKYYNPAELEAANVKYVKLGCPGRIIPSHQHRNEFKTEVLNYASSIHKDKLIGVHCTHGLNRTGFMICAFLIDVLKWDAERSIMEFEYARGHKIERSNYTDYLRSMSRR